MVGFIIKPFKTNLSLSDVRVDNQSVLESDGDTSSESNQFQFALVLLVTSVLVQTKCMICLLILAPVLIVVIAQRKQLQWKHTCIKIRGHPLLPLYLLPYYNNDKHDTMWHSNRVSTAVSSGRTFKFRNFFRYATMYYNLFLMGIFFFKFFDRKHAILDQF